ncbi:sigma-70 family RNA polymerase sigma factor [Agarivorans sp. B2Z047]|uniref:RNA polymerase sigma-70 factor n=1 Tax=Agarivorans albus MKT 106 TaxID=1331007 RepID=R9PIF7_AGAAL|nr:MULTISPECIES: sigma-70 family RNA polymerase sigma factor [Agarivorans]MPW27879.1 sigma-70 family RNA polymerase sigma factor [Agarivorans sp. B2Z047]UQN44286.1 sigma-70 family RNA polymerase sigma factor [Agarivorans sp. B2Z047]GAD01174.1 RNA polymerase sigma-70 factor [Agarivorans albus MKT 106]
MASQVAQPNNDDDIALLLANIASEQCRKSYDLLFRQVAPRLLNLARKQFVDESLALEMVQETMLKLWLKAGLYDSSKGNAMTWIFSVSRNVKFDLMRKGKHQQSWVQGDDLWPILSEEEDADKVSTEDQELVTNELKHLIAKLPEEQADIVRRVYLHGESQQQVSEILNLPLGTVKSRLRLALKKMKEALDD